MGYSAETMTAGPAADTQTGLAEALAEVLAEVMRAEHVPADSHFFTDLGADSLVMAKFCARLRKREDLPSVSMQDIYRHPTITSLVTAFASPVPAPAPASAPAPVSAAASVPVWAVASVPASASAEVAAPAGTGPYLMCAALQLLLFFGYAWVAALAGAWAYRWISAGTGLAGIYLRSVLFGGSAFLALCILPILAKWVLIGRWKPRQIRIWSLDYVRFWVVRTLVRSNPLALLAVGSPLYVLYLRALGAKVGRGTVILSKHVPVCTDLLTRRPWGTPQPCTAGRAYPPASGGTGPRPSAPT